MNNISNRVEILFSQSRFKEAKNILEEHLSNNPNDEMGQFYLATSLFHLGENDRSRMLCNTLLERTPEFPMFLMLAIQIDIDDEYFEAAESKAELLLKLEPEESDVHLLMSRVKLAQRKLDGASTFANSSLALDAENLDARNIKILIDGLLKKDGVSQNLSEALQQDPENPYTIANQGIQLVREGKIDEALERCKYALSLDPNNQIAGYAMREALKSKFFIYRWFFKYKELMSKLSGTASWVFIIGTYFGFKSLRTAAKNNPEYSSFLYPLVFLVAAIFLLMWILDPLMNLFLMTNSYGRLLLDKDEKIMAKGFGVSLVLAICCAILYLISDHLTLLLLAVVFAISLIPLGSFLSVTKKSNQKITIGITICVLLFGIIGALTNTMALLILSGLGVFVYQWIINGMMIKENSRVFE